MLKQMFKCDRCGKDVMKWPNSVKKQAHVYCSLACSNFKPGQQRVCPTCGKSFYARASAMARGYSTYCSKTCSNPARGRAGVQNGNWKGGRFTRSDGYVAVGIVTGGFRGYRLEHDLVMEEHIGRQLLPGENVHHKNEIRADNRLDNLELTTASRHIREHHASQKKLDTWVVVECLNCRKAFAERKNKVDRNPLCFCNRQCYLEGSHKGLIPKRGSKGEPL